MRLIYAWIAYANLRFALAEYGRAELLDRQADEAVDRARALIVVADDFGQRAGLSKRFVPLR